MADTTFEIDIPADSTQAVTAADVLQTLTDRLLANQTASAAAAEAVAKASRAYAGAEGDVNRAAKALELLSFKQAQANADLRAAAPNTPAYAAASAASASLARQQELLNMQLSAAQARLAGYATSLDAASTRARSLASAEQATAAALAKEQAAQTAATKARTDAAKSAKASSLKMNELAEGVGKLPGPLGVGAQRVLGLGVGLEKMASQLGAGKAAALGASVAIAAIAAATIAAAVGVGALVVKGLDALIGSSEEATASMKKLKSNFKGLFSGLKTAGLVKALDQIGREFSEQEITGRALKVVFESIFQPALDALVALQPLIIRAFLQLEIWALKGLIAIKPYGSTITMVAKWFGVFAAVVVGVVAVAIGVFVVALGVAAAAIGAATFAIGWLITNFTQIPGIVIGAISSAFNFVVTKIGEVVAWLQGLSLSGIGQALIDGLVAGITGGAGAILNAMTGAVSGAIDGAKKLLGIASPSKVFAEIGANTAAGMAQGVDAGSTDVASSVDAMLAPPSAAPAATAPAGSGGGHTFTFNISGSAADGDSIAAKVREAVTAILEGDLAQLGGAT
jgi:hypothetical protein